MHEILLHRMFSTQFALPSINALCVSFSLSLYIYISLSRSLYAIAAFTQVRLNCLHFVCLSVFLSLSPSLSINYSFLLSMSNRTPEQVLNNMMN